jgi:serine phosphatase RsbU (regulator of sigma subunit)
MALFVRALELGVKHLLQKDSIHLELEQVVRDIVKKSIIKAHLKEQEKLEIKTLQDKERYNAYQERLAFSKELKIIRNDFYYQMINRDCTALIDFIYQPLDTMCGDAYSVRAIDEHRVFYLVVDGMGKGLSASLTAMLLTAFINHTIDLMLSSFDMKELIYKTMQYIKPILLDDETISIDFICINSLSSVMEYAKFGMPAILMQDKTDALIHIKSNNPPLSLYKAYFTVVEVSVEGVVKFLFYSDCIVENNGRIDGELYGNRLVEDFLDSFTKDELKSKINWGIGIQEDDMSLIFVHKLNLGVYKQKHIQKYKSRLATLEDASRWYEGVWSNIKHDEKVSTSAGVVFTELFMNAYEHGNLGLRSGVKHKLMDSDAYFDALATMEARCEKEITVCVTVLAYQGREYVVTQITDEGEGFDTNILAYIFRDVKNFNGRGVFISRQSSLGIYYNQKGNSVLFLHRARS